MDETTEHEIHTCGWLVQQYGHNGACEFDEEWGECVHCAPFVEGPCIVKCGAPVTEHPNGWECEAGHSHYHDVEYYDDEELAGITRSGYPVATNARRMDGSPL